MASKTGASSQDFSQRFWSMQSRALSELCVIMLLHVVAAASYAATRLARVSKLKAPCMLCSRMDHALYGKAWNSADLICAAHMSEISSLAYCKSHNNFARSDDLCKRCLAACTATDEVNSQSRSRSRRLCSCCSEPFKKTCNTKKLSETANVAESSHVVHGSEEIYRRSQVAAIDKNNLAMPPKDVPERVPADHSKEKAFVVGIAEVSESDGTPGTYEQSTKDNSSSVNVRSTTKPAPSGSTVPSRLFVDRNSSIRNTFISRVNLPSPRPSEIISAKDNNSTTQQEVKALLTQMSSIRGLDYSWTEGATSPDTNVQNDESNGIGRRPSLERNYSVLEPSDANLSTDEAEGEISLESLKRQIELNRKSMAVLYKELDEERSASAIAASQAMAMINRLHEEKAAMQMEALQYLRMMEEQADHDQKAIQDLHDLLTEREKELLDMDSELDNCQRLLQHEQFSGGKFDETMDNKSGYERDVSFDALNGSSLSFDVLHGSDFMMGTMSGFEEEKAYISESPGGLKEELRIYKDMLASDDPQNNQEDGLSGDQTADESTSVQQSVEENQKDECSCSPFDSDKNVSQD